MSGVEAFKKNTPPRALQGGYLNAMDHVILPIWTYGLRVGCSVMWSVESLRSLSSTKEPSDDPHPLFYLKDFEKHSF